MKKRTVQAHRIDITLTPCPEHPGSLRPSVRTSVRDVEVYENESSGDAASSTASSGATSDAYRDGWDRIFGAPPPRGLS